MKVQILRAIGRAVVDLVYPRFCQFCESRDCAHDAPFICRSCLRKVEPTLPPLCERCGLPFEGAVHGAASCSHCRGVEWFFERALSGVRLCGLAQEILHRFKYRKQPFWRLLIGQWLRQAASRGCLAGCNLIVPVPLHPRRERQRQYNQAALLAWGLGEWAGLPVLEQGLRRIRNTPSQTGLGYRERLLNQKGAYQVADPAQVSDCSICLVDDVFTTGATTNECAKTLRQVGAKKVLVLTAARG